MCWARKSVPSPFSLLILFLTFWFCLTSIHSSPEHSQFPYNASVVVHFSSTSATKWHTCSKVCWSRKSAPLPFHSWTPPPPLPDSASHASILRHSTSTSLTMLVLSYYSQAQQPQDDILVAKYVGLENLHHHYSTTEHAPHPLISALHPSILRQSTPSSLTMLVLSYFSQAQQPQDGKRVAKYVGQENLHHHYFTTEHAPHPLISASHPSNHRHSTPSTLTMLLFS